MTNAHVIRKKSERTETQLSLAQYFTPSSIADYMASMFTTQGKSAETSILDAGAGEGILGISLLKQLKKITGKVEATFVELDPETFHTLEHNIELSDTKHKVSLINDDFIDAAFGFERQGNRFSHIILNPPYFKLRVDSVSSKRLRLQGIYVTNIYAAFVWLSASLLKEGGELVAIIPRSFCNGPYFLKFRQFLLAGFSLDSIHIFSSRNKAFAHESVLQENIILHISKRQQRETVKISYSTDQGFTDVGVRMVPFESIVHPTDINKVIHIAAENQILSLTDHVFGKLTDLGVSASTGPIVDFRLKANIKDRSTTTSVPLLYPAHMSGGTIEWPRADFRKLGQYYEPAEAKNTRILDDGVMADKQVMPLDGCYVVVRRFSSKEEKRRIFASVVDPESFPASHVTFENHLNYFHAAKHGFEKNFAHGLCAYLNSSLLDEHFRKVSGHTQVNVSDLKNMPYPSREILERIGTLTQGIHGLIDDIVTKEVLGVLNEHDHED